MPTTFSDEVYDEDRMRSCIYGLAVGDALGVPYEFRERGTFECTNMVGGATQGEVDAAIKRMDERNEGRGRL